MDKLEQFVKRGQAAQSAVDQVIKATTGQTPEPGIKYPRCPHCPIDVLAREDGTKPGDPLQIFRLRYDFPDGVLLETFWCADCRACLGTQIVFFPLPKPQEPPKG